MTTPDASRADLVYRDRQDNVVLGALLRAVDAESVDASVHRSDEMFAYALGACHGSWNDALVLYHQGGASGWGIVRQLVEAASAPRRHWLDFGCGYGRVLRFGRAVDPELAVTACDIDRRAVEHVAGRFGVEGLHSSHRPEDLGATAPASAVTAWSVFTHLPEATFEPWLAQLWSRVAPGGILAVSTNDLAVAPEGLTGGGGAGIVFERHSESDDLSQDLYGTTWVAEHWMRELVARVASGDDAWVRRVPRGLWNAQDLWLVGRSGSDAAGAPEPVEPGLAPIGYLDGVELVGARRVRVAGWAMARSVAAPRVEVRVTSSTGSPLGVAIAGELAPRADLERAHADVGARGGEWLVDLELEADVRGLELLEVLVDGWPLHVSLLDGADRRARLERRVHELEVGQRILRAELERRGGIVLRLARAAARRVASRLRG